MIIAKQIFLILTKRISNEVEYLNHTDYHLTNLMENEAICYKEENS